MGFSSQVQNNQTAGPTYKLPPVQDVNPGPIDGSSGALPNPTNGKITFSGVSNQPSIGRPNQYPNTISQWDNQNQVDPVKMIGKGA